MKCKRCGNKYTDPHPPITNPGGKEEIACVAWCANCNAKTMAALYRQASAYWQHGQRPPWQGEAKEELK